MCIQIGGCRTGCTAGGDVLDFSGIVPSAYFTPLHIKDEDEFGGGYGGGGGSDYDE